MNLFLKKTMSEKSLITKYALTNTFILPDNAKDFQGPKTNFKDFQGLEIRLQKFKGFQGFSKCIQTLSELSEFFLLTFNLMTNMNYDLQSPPTSGYVIICTQRYILLSSVIKKNRNI